MIKKLLCIMISAIILFGCVSSAVFAEKPVTVTLDNKILEFDVQPQIINDRTMVPLRAIFEALGATVLWDDPTKTVTATKPGYTVVATINNPVMEVNGVKKTMDIAPMLVDSRTLVPARFVAEAFDCNVGWDEASYTVIITSQKAVEYLCYPDTVIPDYSAVTGATLKKTESDETGIVYVYPLLNNIDGTSQWKTYENYLLSSGFYLYHQTTNQEFGGPLYTYLNKDNNGVIIGVSMSANEIWITNFEL